MRRILSIILVFVLLTMYVPRSTVYASNNNLYVEVYSSNSFIQKNGAELTDGIPAYRTYTEHPFFVVKNIFYAAGDINVTFDFPDDSDHIVSTYDENCPSSNNGNYFFICPCTSAIYCSQTSTHHHTNVLYIFEDFPTMDTSKKSSLLITASKLCNSDTVKTHTYARGVAKSSDCKAIVSDQEKANGMSMFTSTITHELGHFYGVADHYYDYQMEGQCIWGYRRFSNSVVLHCSMCSDCVQTLRDNNSWYNQTGE